MSKARPQNAFSSVQFSHSVVSDSLRPHELQHSRHPCPSPTPEVYSNSCPSSWWCHPAIFVKMWKSKCFTRSSIPRKYLFPSPPLLQWRARIHGGSRKASGLFGYSIKVAVWLLQSTGAHGHELEPYVNEHPSVSALLYILCRFHKTKLGLSKSLIYFFNERQHALLFPFLLASSKKPKVGTAALVQLRWCKREAMQLWFQSCVL